MGWIILASAFFGFVIGFSIAGLMGYALGYDWAGDTLSASGRQNIVDIIARVDAQRDAAAAPGQLPTDDRDV